MKEITLGQYYPVKSIVHSLDPRTKILATIFVIVLTFISKSYLGLFICALYIFLANFIGKIPFRKMLSSLKAVSFIIAFTFLLNMFFSKRARKSSLWA